MSEMTASGGLRLQEDNSGNARENDRVVTADGLVKEYVGVLVYWLRGWI